MFHKLAFHLTSNKVILVVQELNKWLVDKVYYAVCVVYTDLEIRSYVKQTLIRSYNLHPENAAQPCFQVPTRR